jgi:probable rRNA maturation factor
MEVLITDEQQSVKVNQDFIKAISLDIMDFDGFTSNSQLSLVFCDDEAIKELNNEYRGKDEATDVLSFPIELENFVPEIRMIGDIVISTETAIRQANDYNHSAEAEIVILLIHGLLHLHGYDHIEENDRVKMRARETEVLKYLCDSNKYSELKGLISEPLIKRVSESEQKG